MKLNKIQQPSYWGREVVQRHITVNSTTLVVQFPGKQYPNELPLLYYAAQAALQSGHDVLLLEYGYQAARVELKNEQLPILVDECAASIRKVLSEHTYARILFVSKSLGTVVAGGCAEQLGDEVIKHLFLTPIKATIPYLQRSQGMMIYGTADPLFGPDEVKLTGSLPRMVVVPVEGGDHSLETGEVLATLNVLKELSERYLTFFTSS
jgi:predicted alpha/beta-hydrolase family hydrolase